MIDVGLSPTSIHAGDPVELDISLTNTGTGMCTKVIFEIRLPVGIVRLRGQERFEVSRMSPGQTETSRLRVRAEKAGRYRLTSTNFSYRDHRGQPHRETGFATEITVAPERGPLPQPHVTAGLQAAELPYDEWTIVRSRITNTGTVSVSDLEITLSGQVSTDRRGARGTLEELPPGRSADVPFFVRARDAGASVPVHLDLAYHYQSRRYVATTTHGIRVVRGHVTGSPVAPGSARPSVRFLILAANPSGAESLRLDQEIREIQKTIRSGKERDNMSISIRLAVTTADIQQALLDDEPRLVHFAGHGGGPAESITVMDEHGRAHSIPVAGLVKLFRVAGRGVECVIVNACETELLARGLSTVIPYVIGMRQPVRDKSAIRFSIGFYQAMAAGRSIDDAFELGVAQLMMRPLGSDASAPVLFRRDTGDGQPG
jgi:CHAT domain